jgi:Neurotransmitter-gated ion-channel ligand binding domain/Neurotransmitter-gated ion-channel transmembrane region
MIRALLNGVALLQIVIAMGAVPAYSQSIRQGPSLLAASDKGQPTAQAKESNPELERPTVWGEPTEVRILVYVIDVDEIDSANQTFAASVYVEARWNVPALQHKGPGPLYRSLSDVWNPRLTIVNLQQQWAALPEAVEISPNGEVIYRQRVWGRFSQPLDLQNFPFDRQTLDIQLATVGLLENEVKIVPLKLEHGRQSGIGQRFSVPDFSVVSWKADSSPYIAFKGAPGTAGFLFQIEMARSPIYYLVKVIIPLCLIVMMSWTPSWIDPEQIGANLGISATSFLTLVAYLFAITVLLPRVSYITRMDRFILLSTLLVFLSLVQTVASAALVKRGKSALVNRIDLGSRAVYPVFLLIILFVSFVA